MLKIDSRPPKPSLEIVAFSDLVKIDKSQKYNLILENSEKFTDYNGKNGKRTARTDVEILTL